MNMQAVGPTIWKVIHQSPWRLYPDEILSVSDAVWAILFIENITQMLPCSICFESAAAFKKSINVIKMCSYTINNKRIVTRGKLASFWYTFHNLVNQKPSLQKPVFGTSWKDAIPKQVDWESEWMMLLFVFIEIYPEVNTEDFDKMDRYYFFFGSLIPKVFCHTEFGKAYQNYLKISPLTLSRCKRRTLLYTWLYSFYRNYAPTSSLKTVWELYQIETFLKAFRAKSETCSGPVDIPAQEACT